MAKHHPDLIFCRKQPGVAIGRLCEKCDGKCVICDSYVRPCTLVRICDECNYGSYQGRCVICGGPGVSDAYYCKECTIQEKDRDGCPKIVNLGSAKTDLFYERKKYGFKKRWYRFVAKFPARESSLYQHWRKDLAFEQGLVILLFLKQIFETIFLFDAQFYDKQIQKCDFITHFEPFSELLHQNLWHMLTYWIIFTVFVQEGSFRTKFEPFSKILHQHLC